MGTTIRARFSEGVLKPLEAVGLKEGDEVSVTIVSSSAEASSGSLEKSAGGWVGLVDAEELKRSIYEGRLVSTRSEPRL